MSKPENLQCWKCGASLDYLLMPLSRTATCKACDASIHVCKMCEFYDPHVAKSCSEPVAMEVKEKQRANFCDYLSLRENAYVPLNHSQEEAAKSELNALFGLGSDQGQTRDAGPTSEADRSKEQLEDLFNLGDKKD